jgi:hypothetical protein
LNFNYLKMRKIYFSLLVLCLFGFANAQIVNIPDLNFKNRLINIGVDTNNDGDIQVSEALMVETLSLNYNNISSLEGIESFTNLQTLYVDNNLLTSINVSSLTNLTLLSCEFNSLTVIDITGLNNLIYLYLNHNIFTSLHITGLANLERLECNNNLLTSLQVNNLPKLVNLSFSSNPLSSVNFDSTLPSLKYLYCTFNHLSSLDISPLHALIGLSCYNNIEMAYLNIKNGLINANFTNFQGNWAMEYVCCDDSQIASIQSKLTQYNLYDAHVNSYCSFSPGGVFYTIQGNGKYDYNNNGCDEADIDFSNLKLNITNETISGGTILNSDGSYTLPIQQGTYTINAVLENPSYFLISPTTFNVDFPSQISPLIQNFCISPNGVHNDLEILFFPINPAQPGFNVKYKIVYKNNGTNPQSGNVSLGFDDNKMDLVTSSIPPTNQQTDMLLWDFSNLLPMETRVINITFKINSPAETLPVTIGDQLNFASSINPVLGDELPLDNSSSLKQIVVGSFDPNDKTCLEGTTITPDKVGEYVHYLIRFENTGTANAQNVVVKDIIDTEKFDVSTLFPVSSSHSFVTRITNTNQVEFIFENIQLPFDDANNDGYVAFKIKTKPTLVVGNTFSNTANIYFDYNFPIVTNTATTTIQTLGNSDFQFNNYFTLAPNPVKNSLNIQANQSIELSSISIYNTISQLIFVETNPTNTIDVSNLKTGTYFIKATTNKGTSIGKFIKE